jgi:hypothetical protein
LSKGFQPVAEGDFNHPADGRKERQRRFDTSVNTRPPLPYKEGGFARDTVRNLPVYFAGYSQCSNAFRGFPAVTP